MMSVSLRRDWRFAAFTDWPLPMSEEARWGGGGVVCVGGGRVGRAWPARGGARRGVTKRRVVVRFEAPRVGSNGRKAPKWMRRCTLNHVTLKIGFSVSNDRGVMNRKLFVLVCVLLSLFAFVDARRGSARRRARAARGLDAVGGGASRERPRRTRRPSRPFVRPSVMRAPPPPPPPRHHLDAVDLVRDARDAFTYLAPDLPGAVLYLYRGAGEAARHGCGLGHLLSIGAVNVLRLPRATRDDDDAFDDDDDAFIDAHDAFAHPAPTDIAGLPIDPRAPVVIVTTTLLQRAKRDIARVLRARHQEATRATVYCAVSEECHCAVARALAMARRDRDAAARADEAYERVVRDLRDAVNAPWGRGGGGGGAAGGAPAPATPTPKNSDEVRSLHWSPYDRVGVVNDDP